MVDVLLLAVLHQLKESLGRAGLYLEGATRVDSGTGHAWSFLVGLDGVDGTAAARRRLGHAAPIR
jgi:hypothetical protein